MSSNILSQAESNDLLEIIHSLCAVETVEQLHHASQDFKELAESDHVIFGLPTLRSGVEQTIDEINHDYPEEWVKLYQKKNFWRIDPIVLACKERHVPLHWEDIYKKFPPDPKFLELALDFGIKNGWTCLTQGCYGLPWSIVSVGGDYKKNKERTAFLMERTVTHFHLALSSVRKNDSNVNFDHKLTNREREVLQWISQGKTSWEISVILHIAEATVNYHTKNISKKLNTVGRSQAVAVALHRGLLS